MEVFVILVLENCTSSKAHMTKKVSVVCAAPKSVGDKLHYTLFFYCYFLFLEGTTSVQLLFCMFASVWAETRIEPWHPLLSLLCLNANVLAPTTCKATKAQLINNSISTSQTNRKWHNQQIVFFQFKTKCFSLNNILEIKHIANFSIHTFN